jgi:hypothetical protein
MTQNPESECLLAGLLEQQKDALLNDWFRRIVELYPGETGSFLLGCRDRFANPAAYAFKAAGEAVYDALLENMEVDPGPVEYAVKIAAVQGSDPSGGVGFLRLFKDIIREKLSISIHQDALTDIESRIDRITEKAEEMFIANRRKIAELANASEMRG